MVFGIKERPNSAKGMNPIAYYLNYNSELNKYLDGYFSFIDRIEDEELRNALIDIKTGGTSMEKIQAVSLLAAIKLFFS